MILLVVLFPFLLDVLYSFIGGFSLLFCLKMLNEASKISSNIELLNLSQKSVENCLDFFLSIIHKLAKTLKDHLRVLLKLSHVVQFIFIIELKYLGVSLKFLMGDVVIRSEVLQDLIDRTLLKRLPDGLDLRVEQVFDDSNLGC